jgi:hypothetical protein
MVPVDANARGGTLSIDKRPLTASSTNPYFVLAPGLRLTYKTKSGYDRVTVLNQTTVIDGVRVRVVEDREIEKGRLTELTYDYYAGDRVTRDVYYFGEDVNVYRGDSVVSHEGSWRSGTRGAHFGLIMPGEPKVGMQYLQEAAPGTAMDRGQIASVNETVRTPAGAFHACIRVRETSALEPAVREQKLYAPHIGVVSEGGSELVRVEWTATQH